jgi:hypothetical protein
VSQPVRFKRGEFFQLRFIVYARAATGEEVQTDIPRRNITNDLLRYTAKLNPGQADDGDGVIRKDGENTDEISKTDPTNGEGVVIHLPADTKSLPNRYLYLYTDLEVNVADGTQPQTVIADLLIMELEITIRTAPV